MYIAGDICVIWRLYIICQKNIWICIFPLATVAGTVVSAIVASYYAYQAVYILNQSNLVGSSKASFQDVKSVPWLAAAAALTMV